MELYWQWCRGKDESQAEFRDPLEQCDLGTVMVLVGLLSCVPWRSCRRPGIENYQNLKVMVEMGTASITQHFVGLAV